MIAVLAKRIEKLEKPNVFKSQPIESYLAELLRQAESMR